MAKTKEGEIIWHGSVLPIFLRPLGVIVASDSAIIKLKNKDTVIDFIENFGRYGLIYLFFSNDDIESKLVKLISNSMKVSLTSEVLKSSQSRFALSFDGDTVNGVEDVYFSMSSNDEFRTVFELLLERAEVDLIRDKRDLINYKEVPDKLVDLAKKDNCELDEKEEFSCLLDILLNSDDEILIDLGNRFINKPERFGLWKVSDRRFSKYFTEINDQIKKYVSYQSDIK